MKNPCRYYALLFPFIASLLGGCALLGGGSAHDKGSAFLPIIEPEMRQDLDDGHIKDAVQNYLKLRNAPPFTQYDFMRVDLNTDGWRDALVYLNAPYGQWCYVGGCTILVLHAQENDFRITSEISPIRTPLYISETYSNGWRDIIVHISGRTEKAKDVVLRFNGLQYQGTPTTLMAEDQALHPVHMRAFP
ncbi:MAG: hypothetical protein COA45_03590 [Zetaproteobacteria bacterium]|nr:MAG: hypothetical protein COA45_03590 [Zetaproteobacteria bacterium]